MKKPNPKKPNPKVVAMPATIHGEARRLAEFVIATDFTPEFVGKALVLAEDEVAYLGLQIEDQKGEPDGALELRYLKAKAYHAVLRALAPFAMPEAAANMDAAHEQLEKACEPTRRSLRPCFCSNWEISRFGCTCKMDPEERDAFRAPLGEQN